MTLAIVQTHADLDIWPFDLKYEYWSRFRNPGSGSWSVSPPKSNHWSLGHAPHLRKIRRNPFIKNNSSRHTAKCQFMPYLLIECEPPPKTVRDKLRTTQLPRWWWCVQWTLCYHAAMAHTYARAKNMYQHKCRTPIVALLTSVTILRREQNHVTKEKYQINVQCKQWTSK